ncbi:MAG: DUF423 domain-containing protein [Bacteroidota bacterium]
MNKSFLIIASIFGALAVMLGAFGAHTLKPLISEDYLRIYEKGVSYQFYHTIALLLSALMMERNGSKYLRWACRSFIFGIICFSGSLYVLATRDLIGISNVSIIGPITPIGGLGFILGWLFLLIGNIKKQE